MAQATIDANEADLIAIGEALPGQPGSGRAAARSSAVEQVGRDYVLYRWAEGIYGLPDGR